MERASSHMPKFYIEVSCEEGEVYVQVRYGGGGACACSSKQNTSKCKTNTGEKMGRIKVLIL